ncbi:hypothetical protein HQ590_00310 [bacterium]|nr:hypothetical protein [bacterium]
MPELIKRGHIYIAQPPLYKIKRRKREEYIENDDQMTRVLVELGSEDVRLYRMRDKKEFSGPQLISVLESLRELEKLVDRIERRGIRFEDYLAARHPKTGAFPSYALRIKEEGTTRFEFACGDKEWAKVCAKYNVDLDAERTAESRNGDNGQGPQVRPLELAESNSIGDAIKSLEKRGFNLDHYAAQEKPLFDLVEGNAAGDGEEKDSPPARGPKKSRSKQEERRTPVHAIPEILERIKELGRRGLLIQRYKGLGEMNPEQLWETTMDPERRKMLKVVLEDPASADEIFTVLMGDEVEPRRQFIQENALNVRNLDV